MRGRGQQVQTNYVPVKFCSSRLCRLLIVFILPALLGACTALENSFNEKIKQNKLLNTKLHIRPKKVLLKGLPRHLMISPHKEFVWLWNKPGGTRARAMRITKIPSGSVGRVLEYEPEIARHAAWNEEAYENFHRQPIRWVKVATSSGEGWVRTEFISPR